jgi:hypothetical protein
MKRLTKATLEGLCFELAAHPWDDRELSELVDPRLGIITGFQELLDELEVLRRTDLGTLPPAQGVQRLERK